MPRLNPKKHLRNGAESYILRLFEHKKYANHYFESSREVQDELYSTFNVYFSGCHIREELFNLSKKRKIGVLEFSRNRKIYFANKNKARIEKALLGRNK